MRILGIDPGEKRIGLAISDETGLIANPVGVIIHVSRRQDADAIVQKTIQLGAELIVIGCAYDPEGEPSPSGRKAIRLGEEIKNMTTLPIEYMDEYGTTNLAQQTGIEMGIGKKSRRGHRDEIAAVIILQDYLESKRPGGV
jgi:putative holliday junction resolvase